MISRRLIAFTVVLLVALPSTADTPLLEFSSTNFQLLWGNRYKLGTKQRHIATLEHANRWRYGDFYGFLDIDLENDFPAYAELHPRLSLKRLGVKNVETRFTGDLYLAAQVELVDGGIQRYLYGIGTDLKVPGFQYMKLNTYVRNNPQLQGNTLQATLSWGTEFEVGNASLQFEGFADLVGREGASHSYQLIVPRLLLELKSLSRVTRKNVFLGFEYQYWRNKFGRRGVTESVPQLQLKMQL